MRILLTGSSGTIGTRLFERLLENGYSVTGLDRKPNVWKPELDKKTRLVDLLNAQSLERMDGIDRKYDMIIHFAANARVYDLVKTPGLALENAITTFNILEFARARDIDKMIFSSSRETYGNIAEGTAISEDCVRVEHCESPYAASKIAGEAYFRSYAACYGIQSVILRFSNVYGMYDDSDRVIPLWIRQLRRNDDIVVFGKKKTLDFTYIDDCVDGIARAVGQFDRVAGETLNIAYGDDVALVAVAERLKQLLGASSKIDILDNRPGEVWKFKADISKARKLLGYHPKVAWEEGLKKTVAWYNDNLK